MMHATHDRVSFRMHERVPSKRYYDNYGGLLCFFSLNVISATLSGKFGCSFAGVKQIYYGTEFNELEK